jgi:hypothetical protein
VSSELLRQGAQGASDACTVLLLVADTFLTCRRCVTSPHTTTMMGFGADSATGATRACFQSGSAEEQKRQKNSSLQGDRVSKLGR